MACMASPQITRTIALSNFPEAPTAFLYDFVAQQIGMSGLGFEKNMLDVHNENISFFSPQVLPLMRHNQPLLHQEKVLF
jgi:hypothetical protein